MDTFFKPDKPKSCYGSIPAGMSEISDKLYTTEEAAEILGVSPDTLYCWKSTKRYYLPVVKVGRLNKYRHSDLMHFIQERTINKLGE